MNFYKLQTCHIGGPAFAWASGYGRIATSMDEIPFLKDAPDALKRNLDQFWEVSKPAPGIKFDPGGKAWPDILGCGLGTPFFFVSERVLTDLQQSGVPYLRATEMPLVPPFPKKLREIPPPKYFVLEGIPGLEVAWGAMGIPHDSDNRVNFSGGYPKPWPPREWMVSGASWTGLDLMSYKNFQMPMTLVCTDEIKDLAKGRSWTNIAFKPVKTL